MTANHHETCVICHASGSCEHNTAATQPAKCERCDRVECRRAATQHRELCGVTSCEDDDPRDLVGCNGCISEHDCERHTIDWRTRCLAAEAEIDRLTAEVARMQGERDAAREHRNSMRNQLDQHADACKRAGERIPVIERERDAAIARLKSAEERANRFKTIAPTKREEAPAMETRENWTTTTRLERIEILARKVVLSRHDDLDAGSINWVAVLGCHLDALASALNEPSIWNKAHPAPPIPTPATPAVPVKHLLDWNDKTHGFDCSECKRPAGECAILSPVAIELAPPAMQGEPTPMPDPLTVNDAIDLLKLSMPVADQLKVIAAEFVTARQQLEAALARLTQERDTYAQAAADRGEEKHQLARRVQSEIDRIAAVAMQRDEAESKSRGLELELAAERAWGTTLAGLLKNLPFTIGQLRHLYDHMVNGAVKDCKEAANGLLAPEIRQLEMIYAALANHPAPANGKEE